MERLDQNICMASVDCGTVIIAYLIGNDILLKSWNCHRVTVLELLLQKETGLSCQHCLQRAFNCYGTLSKLQLYFLGEAECFWLPNIGSGIPPFLHAVGEPCVYSHFKH